MLEYNVFIVTKITAFHCFSSYVPGVFLFLFFFVLDVSVYKFSQFVTELWTDRRSSRLHKKRL